MSGKRKTQLSKPKQKKRTEYIKQRILEGAGPAEIQHECAERWGPLVNWGLINKLRADVQSNPPPTPKKEPKVEVLVVQEGIQSVVARLLDAMHSEGITTLTVTADGEYTYTRRGKL